MHTYIFAYICTCVNKYIMWAGAISSHVELQQLYMNIVHCDREAAAKEDMYMLCDAGITSR